MEQERSIETSQLLIKGNLIIWEKMMIQISSISYFSEAPLEKRPFPKWSLLPLAASLWIFQYSNMFALVIMGIGIGWILVWLQINRMRQEKRVLTIATNSNKVFYFLFKDKAFLHKAMKVLELILIDGSIGNKNIVINIKDNKFSGNANFLNSLKA